MFGYNDDSDHRWRLLHYGTWEDDLRDNLDRGWPVIYGACGDPEIDWHSLFHQGNFINIPGHAFVCDGYCSTPFVLDTFGVGVEKSVSLIMAEGSLSLAKYAYTIQQIPDVCVIVV